MPRIGPLKLRARIFCGAERAMGPGRADLLEAIDRQGSITAAGRALGMSYRFTWLLVDSMNRCFEEKLVETSKGGHGHGGATLTAAGRRALVAYRALEAAIAEAAANRHLDELVSMMRAEPRPAATPSPCAVRTPSTIAVD